MIPGIAVDLCEELSHNSHMRATYPKWIGLILICVVYSTAAANPIMPPGDMQFRNDLQLLNDSGITNIPLTAWPIALGDVHLALADTDVRSLSASARSAYDRVRDRTRWELETDSIGVRLELSGASNPRIIRTFENTPREQGEARAELSWLGERFSMNLAAAYADNPFDGEEFRPDGTYLGVALGNWMVMAGWQERWWGPGRDGSLILSTNARPRPGVTLQRINSAPYKTKWLSWMGPWTFTTFMDVLDDEREIEDAWLFGMRGSFRPPGTGLEIGINRAAQWCGEDRPCDLEIFFNLLLGRDNRGANVDPEDEPGNQLAGIDIRWTLPKQTPVALYMQWIAEDTRRTGASFHQWVRQVGVEYWGSFGNTSHRTHFEVSDTSSRLGAFGEGSPTPNFAYNHAIYRTGYRYRNRSLGHPTDNDSLSYSIGSTLVQAAGHTWNVSLRYVQINRLGRPDQRNSLSPTPQELTDLQFSYEHQSRFGRFYVGLGYSRLNDEASDSSSSDTTGFIRWSSQ